MSNSDQAPTTQPAATSRRRRLADRFGRAAVAAGGLAIIAGVMGILVFILVETAPLVRGARVVPDVSRADAALGDGPLVADEKRDAAAFLAADGTLRAFDWAGGPSREIAPTAAKNAGAALVATTSLSGGPGFVAATSDGRAFLARLVWRTAPQGASAPAIAAEALLEIDPSRRPAALVAGALADDGGATAAAMLADGHLVVLRRAVEKNEITGESSAAEARLDLGAPGRVAALALAGDGKRLFVGGDDGTLRCYALGDFTATPADASGPAQTAAPETAAAPPIESRVSNAPIAAAARPLEARVSEAPITALAPLLGDRAIVVGQADGALTVWQTARGDDGAPRLVEIHRFPKRRAAVRAIAASPRQHGFFALDAAGGLGLFHSTSERTLWTGQAAIPAPRSLAFAPKSDGLFVAGGGRAADYAVDNPHPEVGFKALFGKVWYEGYDKPDYVWQSSSGADDFEPKLSLTPLLFGTLKGTFYSLILAVPIGVLGAMYASQFMHHRIKKYVKPVVEIMAALPSVVLGFLAGLWLAPRLESGFSGALLMFLFVPLAAVAAGRLYDRLPAEARRRLPSGTEALVAVFFLAAGVWCSVELGPAVERLFFGGRFPGWLLSTFGATYDQRNAVVVGLAMGFAVIPIIFSVAEEAFSNVPKGLVAGSLALGASRWQTVTKVVLPSASPGIFSAIMIGFGRAVGETMIVLMATGNTPIMSLSPFNGFRTLSANIAVEVPEAPLGGTLYRTLFLAGLLLFALTFAVNTAAELVRQRLRNRFSNL
ncbi:MAG: ABC transporter permease subunit [Candidatus Polarisedimenticolia bacterium]